MGASIFVVPATPELVAAVAEGARAEDAAEFWAAAHMLPLPGLLKCCEVSEESWCALADGEPLAIFGVGRIADGVGAPWMLAHVRIGDARGDFMAACRAELARIHKTWAVLLNYVDARNLRSIRWLRSLGFTIGDPEPYGLDQLPFRSFWRSRDV